MEQLKTDIDSVHVAITPEIEARINAAYQLHGSPAP